MEPNPGWDFSFFTSWNFCSTTDPFILTIHLITPSLPLPEALSALGLFVSQRGEGPPRWLVRGMSQGLVSDALTLAFSPDQVHQSAFRNLLEIF